MTEEEKKLQPETLEEAPKTSQSGTTASRTGTQNINTATAPVYTDTYGEQLKAQYDAIVNRKPFSYNAAEDPLYQQYVDKYVQGGRLAMKDTMGQAAALTGGYGSSYGQAVGQQQYNEYMRSLADALPELYSTAYDQYLSEGDQMNQQYAMLGDLAADEYSKYRDAYSDWQYNEQIGYERQQDAYGNLQNLIAATGLQPTQDMLSTSGMTQEEADALRRAWAMDDPELALRGGYITEDEYYVLTGKKAGGGGGGSGGGSTYSQMQSAMQDAIAEGASRIDINNAIMQNPGLSSEEKRQLISSNTAKVNYSMSNWL